MKKLYELQLEEMENWSSEQLQKTFIVLTMLEEQMKNDKSEKYTQEDFLQVEQAKNTTKEYMFKAISKENF